MRGRWLALALLTGCLDLTPDPRETLAALPSSVPAPADNPTRPETVELGRLLFWDPVLRVLVGDAEIEVHGTAFVVTARDGQLVDVVVEHGVVEVRAGETRRMLTAGQSWREPTRTATAIIPDDVVAPPVVRPAPRVPPVVAHRDPPPPPPRVPEELAYDDAWAAMRSGRFTQAASAFARVQLLAPTGPLAEDAGFWYAVALARSGQPALAGDAFRDHLAAFPASRRAGEASAMLGWILVERGQTREAAQRFRAAIIDPVPEVRASARAGLAAVEGTAD